MPFSKKSDQQRKIVVIGFGNIGQGVVPLLEKHFPNYPITIIEQKFNAAQKAIIQKHQLHSIETAITADNYHQILTPLLSAGDFLLNIANCVSTVDVIKLVQAQGALYLDTVIEPWQYSHTQEGIETSNYSLREQVLELRRNSAPNQPTAVVCQGANPGFVSTLAKYGLMEMAKKFGLASEAPQSQNDWAKLAKQLDIRVMQVSERDTQVSKLPRQPDEFVNTWSVEGFITECLQPAELGWGTHEKTLPALAKTHPTGSQAAIYIEQPSFTVKVKSWSPNYLDFEAFLITHNEAISLADYFTYREKDVVSYRPTSYYAYHPCDDAVSSVALLADNNAEKVKAERVIKEEICSGIDELGVFLISGKYPSLWIGSNLSIGKTRKMAPYNNATSLQVVSSIVAGMHWMLDNPKAGIVESEQLDYQTIYNLTAPYWAPIVQQYIEWQPAPHSTYEFNDFRILSTAKQHGKITSQA